MTNVILWKNVEIEWLGLNPNVFEIFPNHINGFDPNNELV